MKESVRTYDPTICAVFRRNRDQWGGLSNFYPARLDVNGLRIHHSEGLYQAMRFPHRPDIQRSVCAQRNPMASKRTAHKEIDRTRADWRDINIAAMRWTLRVKYLLSRPFAELLAETGEMPIVECSEKDTFWGANHKEGNLVGTNALGRLLMELREQTTEIGAEAISPLAAPNIRSPFINGLRIPVIRDPNEKTVVPPGGMTADIRRKDAYDIFIGRPSRLGNPYHIGKDGPRKVVIAKFESWLRDQITAGQFTLGYIASLYGKVLGCYCAPQDCHGYIWLYYAKWAQSLTFQQVRAGNPELPPRLTPAELAA